MKLEKIIDKYSQKYDLIGEDNNLKKKIIHELAYEIDELRMNSKKDYEDSVFKLCRKNFVKRKIKNYNTKDKIMEYIYMYIMRRPAYYIKKFLKMQMEMPKEFYLMPAYYWEYTQEFGWSGYWGDDIIDNMEHYDNIFESLCDDKSKYNFVNIMMARLTNNWKYYSLCYDSREKEYFDKEIIDLLPGQIIVDGGGYIGDTYEHFCRIYGKSQVKRWYLYEPDRINIQKAREKLKNDNKVVFRQVGLAEKNNRINFVSTGTVGSKSGEGDAESIEVVSVDEDINEKITFLKFDVEGMELEALKGAKRHICEDAPILVICLYHKKKDIPELVNYVKSLNPNYKLYIRHYSVAHWDTVLYAKL